MWERKHGNYVNIEFMSEILKIIKYFHFKNTLYSLGDTEFINKLKDF